MFSNDYQLRATLPCIAWLAPHPTAQSIDHPRWASVNCNILQFQLLILLYNLHCIEAVCKLESKSYDTYSY